MGITERHQRSAVDAIFIQALDYPPKREWKKAAVFVMTALKMKSGSKMLLKMYFRGSLNLDLSVKSTTMKEKVGQGK